MLHRQFSFVLVAAATLLGNSFLFAQDTSSTQSTPPSISFSAPMSIKLSSDPSQDAAPILAGDLNGDGDTDLIAAYGNPAAIHVLFGDGKGGFTPASSNPPADFYGRTDVPGSMLNLVDLNGDGKLDMLQVYPGSIDSSQCQDSSPTIVTVWLGDGTGGFAAPISYNLDPADSIASTYGDFNGDGKIDLAIYTYNTDGSNCGFPGPTLNILLNSGDGTFASAQIDTVAALRSELASTALGPQSSTAAKNSNKVSGFGAMVAGDFNGDGKVDLVLTLPFDSESGNLHLLYGDGKGGFQPGYNYTVDSQIISMAATDLNGDKKTDLVLGLTAKNAPGALPRIATLLARQSGGFYWAGATALPSTFDPRAIFPQLLAFEDLDGDGKPDILISAAGKPLVNNIDTSYILALPGEGNGRFGSPQEFLAGSGGIVVSSVVAPFKRGGLPEVFLASGYEASGTYFYYLANRSK